MVHERNRDSLFAVRAKWACSSALAFAVAIALGPAAAGAQQRADDKAGSTGRAAPKKRAAPPAQSAAAPAKRVEAKAAEAPKAQAVPAAAKVESAPQPAPAAAPKPAPLSASSEVKAKAEEKPAAAEAEEDESPSKMTLHVTSMTLIQGRADPGQERTVVPIIEQLGLLASDIPNPVVSDLKLCLSAWGRLDPVDESARLGKAADLDLGFISGSFLDRAVTFTLGRHLAFGGARRATQLDGLSAEATIFKGLGVSAYGGAPVVPRFASALGDAVFGGRVFYRPSPDAQVGVSFFELLDHGNLARQEASVDGRLMLGPVTVSGFGAFALADGRLAEAKLDAEYEATKSLWAHVDIGRTAPDLFISRTSIFSVFAAERRDQVGGGLSLRADRWRLSGEYHFLAHAAESGEAPRSGHEGLARATYRPSSSSSLGVEARGLLAPVNGYLEGRIFGTKRFAEVVALTLDLDAYRLENPIRGTRSSYVASLSGSYNFAPGWLIALTGLASVTPFFEHRFEALGKLVYNFSTSQEVRP